MEHESWSAWGIKSELRGRAYTVTEQDPVGLLAQRLSVPADSLMTGNELHSVSVTFP